MKSQNNCMGIAVGHSTSYLNNCESLPDGHDLLYFVPCAVTYMKLRIALNWLLINVRGLATWRENATSNSYSVFPKHTPKARQEFKDCLSKKKKYIYILQSSSSILGGEENKAEKERGKFRS